MKMPSVLKNKAGFTLVQAIFILVVLALLGSVMMRLSGVQSSTSLFAIQGARAYQAARSGLEWGAARAGSGACGNNTMTIENFSVTVNCSSTGFVEGPGPSYSIYQISSVASYGNYGSPDYVQRRVEAKVKLP
ncbi:MAG: pilus assembly protein MshP [Desulfuromonadaceae bacterium]|nr:pilus assembly protein MshP [Desulfuromonadaceae bacterium]